MARRRQIIALSYDPANTDAVRVLALIDQTVPLGQRSATIWRWLAAYLDGEQHTVPLESAPADEYDDLFDDL